MQCDKWRLNRLCVRVCTGFFVFIILLLFKILLDNILIFLYFLYFIALSICNWWKGEAGTTTTTKKPWRYRESTENESEWETRPRRMTKNFHISFGTEPTVRIWKKTNLIKTTRFQPKKKNLRTEIINLLHLIRMRLVRLFVVFVLCAMVLVQVLAVSNDSPRF